MIRIYRNEDPVEPRTKFIFLFNQIIRENYQYIISPTMSETPIGVIKFYDD